MNTKMNNASDFVCFVGNKEETNKDKIRLRIKNYLELDNVSILAGAGTSFHLGAPVIRTIPEKINIALTAHKDLKEFYEKQIKSVSKNYKDISLEDFINYLQAERFTAKKRNEDVENYNKLIVEIQNQLFQLCNTAYTDLQEEYSGDKQLKEPTFKEQVQQQRLRLGFYNPDISWVCC